MEHAQYNTLIKNYIYRSHVIYFGQNQNVFFVGWKTSKKLSVFVINRLKEIKQAQGVKIRYVPSKDNAADLANRGYTVQELIEITADKKT